MMISLKYSMMINFREKVGKKKKGDSHTHMGFKRGGKEESMSDGFI